jgi:hypothetical protein
MRQVYCTEKESVMENDKEIMEEMREESCSIQVAVDDGRQVAEMCFL